MISSCNYDGSGRNVVLHSTDTLRHPFSITTFEDWVYWTDWDKEAVFRANKFNGKDVEPVTALHMVRIERLDEIETEIIYFCPLGNTASTSDDHSRIPPLPTA